VFARFIEVLCVTAEARMGHSSDIKNLLSDFAEAPHTWVRQLHDDLREFGRLLP
jgi:long-chain acyl-CoA synthetase